MSDLLTRLAREAERTRIRARNGIKYASGTEWAPEQPTASDVVWRQATASLRRYRSDRVRFREPVVLFVGLVSRSYILDLHREKSVIKYLRDAGLDVYLLDWGMPGPGESGNTLETYVQRYLPRALRAALEKSRASSCSLVGYCMGGNLALLGLASQPLPVTSLVAMATPVDFKAMPAALRGSSLDPDELVDATGNVPPQYLSAFFRVRKHASDRPNLARLWENLCDDEYVEAHQAMARWAREHVPFPGAAFRQVSDQWLRGNAFVAGGLRLAGEAVDLRTVACPTLSIFAAHDELVPPEAVRPLGDVIGASEFSALELDAGHAGLTTSQMAATTTLPALSAWLTEHNEELS
jgi:polyhydroxyalkanoate synthase